MELKELPINKIHPNPLQPREHFDREKIQELADSIKEADLLQPIVVRQKDGGYEIVAGERRWRAFKILNKKIMPSVIWNAKDDVDALEKGTIENWHRLGLSDREWERVINELWKSKRYKSKAEMSRKTGIPSQSIEDYTESSDFKVRVPEISKVSHTKIRATRGLPDEERARMLKESEKREMPARQFEEKFVPTIKKSPEHIRESLIEGDIDADEADEIMDMEEEDQRTALRMKQQGSLSMGEIRNTIERTKEHPMHEGRTMDGDDLILDIDSGCQTIMDNVKSFLALRSIEDTGQATITIETIEQTIHNLQELKKFLQGVV